MSNTENGKTESQTCVEGDEATCARVGGSWLSKYCCLPKATCDLGEVAACGRVKGTWTGTYCCLAPDYRPASADDEASCAEIGGAWTGRRCLVK